MSGLVGIGALIDELSDEFPGLTVSKVRFLEAQGLLDPIRTPGGYRKYSQADRDRLRFILRAQRDQFLPLKVIGEQLEALDRGAPEETPAGAPVPPGDAGSGSGAWAEPDVRVTEAELLRVSGLTRALLQEALAQGVLPEPVDGRYGIAEVEAARAIAGLADFGVAPRHLRAIRLAADRHLGLVEQVAAGAPRDRATRGRAVRSLVALTSRLENALLASRVRRDFGAAGD